MALTGYNPCNANTHQIVICATFRKFASHLVDVDQTQLVVDKWLADMQQTDLSTLTLEFQQLLLSLVPDSADEAFAESDRPTKRRRTGDGIVQDAAPKFERLAQLVEEKLAWPGHEGFPGLHKKALQQFAHLKEADQEGVIASLGEISCLSSTNAAEADPGPSTCCRICSDHSAKVLDNAPNTHCLEAASILSALIKWPGFQRSKRLRVLGMLVLRRIVNHCGDNDLVDLRPGGSLGPWCLQSLRSSLRELRLAAGWSLTAFVRASVSPKFRKSNRVCALEVLRVLSDRQEMEIQETIVIALAHLAAVCGEAELNIVLLRLVDYLGYTQPLISSVAFDEILRLAERRGCSPEDLFRPYWRTVAREVVKDLRSRPQKAQQLCELLSITVPRFLLQTQAETIPYLILTKNRDLLQRIATARNVEIQDICLQPPKHLGMILAHLLLANFPNPEEEISRLLCEATPRFQEADVGQLIRLEPIPIACEMLKVAGEQPESKKGAAHKAIATFVAYFERKHGRSTNKTATQLLAHFLEDHVLGIMTHFSDIIDARTDIYSTTEKARCIRAIAEMISLAGSHFNLGMAVPQIRACLPNAVNEPELCDEAFSAWATLLETVEEEDAETLVEHTFAIIVQAWDCFSDETRLRAYNLISTLIKKFNGLFKDKILSLPSLGSITMLSKFESEIAKFKNGAPLAAHFEAFSLRCSDENKVVVEQALLELLPFLESNQNFIHSSVMTTQPNAVIPLLTRSLLDASTRFLEVSPRISNLCAQCLGIIGCMDPNRIEATRTKHEVMVLSNFERLDETVDFVAHLLEHILVKAFHSASSGKMQNYLAYAMQELLKHCDFKSAVHRPRSSQTGPQSQRWAAMSESARSTLMPYFNSRYLFAKSAESSIRKEYPIFKPSMTHAAWLRTFVSDLLERGKGDNAKIFFPVLSRIIRGHDLSIPSFLLPFTVLNVILGGTEEEVVNVQAELLSILGHHIAVLSLEEAENVKQCSEVSMFLKILRIANVIIECVRSPRLSLSLAPTKTESR